MAILCTNPNIFITKSQPWFSWAEVITIVYCEHVSISESNHIKILKKASANILVVLENSKSYKRTVLPGNHLVGVMAVLGQLRQPEDADILLWQVNMRWGGLLDLGGKRGKSQVHLGGILKAAHRKKVVRFFMLTLSGFTIALCVCICGRA